MSIDAVYTWVNHQDPQWVEWHTAARAELADPTKHLPSALDSARFHNRNELQYSIRSLHKYAPWINNIFVVTNCALPEIIAKDPKVTAVAHEEIFSDTSGLPTFNSRAIEANFHRISGLSECFLYFNDDVFLSSTVSPSDFFSASGKPYLFPSKHDIPYGKKTGLRPVDVGAIKTGKLLEKDFGFLPDKKLHHAPHAMKKSVLWEIESRYGATLRETMKHRFRDNADLPMATTLQAYYSLVQGHSEIGNIRCRYIDIGDPLFLLLITPFSPLCRGKYQTFCLNEVNSVGWFSKPRDFVVKRFLEKMYAI